MTSTYRPQALFVCALHLHLPLSLTEINAHVFKNVYTLFLQPLGRWGSSPIDHIYKVIKGPRFFHNKRACNNRATLPMCRHFGVFALEPGKISQIYRELTVIRRCSQHPAIEITTIYRIAAADALNMPKPNRENTPRASTEIHEPVRCRAA